MKSKLVTPPATDATAPVVRVVDWEAMEPEWRAGITTKLDLSIKYGVSRAAIDKHWAKAGVERDLTARIQAKADALVTQQAVTQQVTTATKSMEKELVSANGALVANVRISHRKDIARSRTLSMRMIEELESQTAQVPELAILGELMRRPDDKGMDKLNDLYQKIISLPARTKTMKDLGDTLKTLIGLEREAYNIGTSPAEELGNGVASFLAGLKRSALPVVTEVEADDDR